MTKLTQLLGFWKGNLFFGLKQFKHFTCNDCCSPQSERNQLSITHLLDDLPYTNGQNIIGPASIDALTLKKLTQVNINHSQNVQFFVVKPPLNIHLHAQWCYAKKNSTLINNSKLYPVKVSNTWSKLKLKDSSYNVLN